MKIIFKGIDVKGLEEMEAVKVKDILENNELEAFIADGNLYIEERESNE